MELRDPSWLHDDVVETLRRHGSALCIHDLLEDHPWVLTTDWAYVLFLRPDTPSAAERLGSWLDEGRDVCAYFNNDWHGFAVEDALWLREWLAGAYAPSP